MRFEVITRVNIKIVVLWNVTPHSMVDRTNVYEKSAAPIFRVGEYCDIFDGTSDMNAATQRPGTDFGVSYATVFEYTGQRNINPLLRDVYKQNAYFRGNEYC
jgi:hypothetical protein